MKITDKMLKSVWLQDTSVYMVNQTAPGHEVYKSNDYLDTAKAIKTGIVKDAKAISSAGACGTAQAALQFEGGDFEEFKEYVLNAAKLLKSAKQNSNELKNAVDFVLDKMFSGNSITNSKMRAFEAASYFIFQNS